MVCGYTFLGFAGWSSWICDLFSHFRTQDVLALIAIGFAVLLGRYHRTVAVLAVFGAVNVAAGDEKPDQPSRRPWSGLSRRDAENGWAVAAAAGDTESLQGAHIDFPSSSTTTPYGVAVAPGMQAGSAVSTNLQTLGSFVGIIFVPGVSLQVSSGGLSGTLDSTSSGGAATMAIAASSVPEIDPAGVGSVLALVTGALGLFELCRRQAA